MSFPLLLLDDRCRKSDRGLSSVNCYIQPWFCTLVDGCLPCKSTIQASMVGVSNSLRSGSSRPMLLPFSSISSHVWHLYYMAMVVKHLHVPLSINDEQKHNKSHTGWVVARIKGPRTANIRYIHYCSVTQNVPTLPALSVNKCGGRRCATCEVVQTSQFYR